MRVRAANSFDLDLLIGFIIEEAREAEGRELDRATLVRGIKAALDAPSIAQYWVLIDDSDAPCGTISITKEWSEWNARYYWWIQSIYIDAGQRGKGHMALLLAAVIEAAQTEECKELRLYVHEANHVAIKAYEKARFRNSPYRIMTLNL